MFETIKRWNGLLKLMDLHHAESLQKETVTKY